mmetsp:Transcript_28177/g.74391  ORF Transcript_28177/g.74391 Transcript_28177/m.74391 type:complete len:128 (-) Transcript_28177:480-863(-)
MQALFNSPTTPTLPTIGNGMDAPKSNYDCFLALRQVQLARLQMQMQRTQIDQAIKLLQDQYLTIITNVQSSNEAAPAPTEASSSDTQANKPDWCQTSDSESKSTKSESRCGKIVLDGEVITKGSFDS